MGWHRMNVPETLEALHASSRGLSAAAAAERLAEYGPNELQEKKRKTPLLMFLDQFKDFMILILIAAAVISGAIGDATDTVAIIVIVLINAVLGFVQEYRAEQAMAALKKMAAPAAVVMRDGAARSIPSSELVPGDVVLLEAGNIAPADLRLIEAARLKVEEAALTGESVAVDKQTAAIPEEGIPLGDRRNMVYNGTTVAYGRGAGVVVAMGMETELGKIAGLLQAEEETKTPLQRRLGQFGRRLSILVISLCAVFFFVGVLRGEAPLTMFLIALTLIVAAIPESLPAVVSISLALAAKKMAKQNALVRKLPAVEALGSVTYICTDKTGTLTLNKMTVEEVWVDGRAMQRQGDGGTGGWGGGIEAKHAGASSLRLPLSASPRQLFLTALALSNDAQADASGSVIGDPTETALYRAAFESGFDKSDLERQLPRVAELPFDSERKSMTTVHENAVKRRESGVMSQRYVSFTKGAVDVLLGKSVNVMTSEGLQPLNAQEILRQSERMASEGLRVLYVGMRTWDALPEQACHETCETGLTLLGLVGMMDPPREEAREAVALCRTAGIKAVMITGDHPLTARAIARRIGIIDDGSRAVITGRELEKLPPGEFADRVEDLRVYARVAPEQKLTIVKALQDTGQLVAMTGDGVNDAPALKKSDIGVAMGVTGTDVAKQAAHMVLLDDNFATIVRAVREGRRIYDGIIKMIRYVLSTNAGEIMLIFFAPLLGLPIPLLPIHILWLNLITDGLPSLAFAVGPAERDIMTRPPRDPRAGILDAAMAWKILWTGFLLAAGGLVLQAWAVGALGAKWQTMLFTFLCLAELGAALALTSEQQSFFTMQPKKIRAMLGAVALTVLLQLLVIYVPVLNGVFQTAPLAPGELGITLAASALLFIALEVEKVLRGPGRRTTAS